MENSKRGRPSVATSQPVPLAHSERELGNSVRTICAGLPTMLETQLALACDASGLESALELLAKAFQRSPQAVQAFLDGVDCTAELCRTNLDWGLALGANELRITFQPSDRLRDFLLASGARDVDGLLVDI